MTKELTLKYITGLIWLLLKQKDSTPEELEKVRVRMEFLEDELRKTGATDETFINLSNKADVFVHMRIEELTSAQLLFIGKLVYGQMTTLDKNVII